MLIRGSIEMNQVSRPYLVIALLVSSLIAGGLFLLKKPFLSHHSSSSGGGHLQVPSNVTLSALLNKQNIVPLAIIGSGPAGLSAAIYGARGKVKTVVFQGEEPGGLLTKTSYVENWPGFKKILGKDIIKNLQDQAEIFGATLLNEQVTAVDLSSWPFTLTLGNGQTVTALTIVIATGSTPRTLGVPGEQEYWARGVTTCAICDAPFYKNEEVVVVGGGDSAIEEAMQLAPYAKKITILVRKESMRAAPSMQDHLKDYPHISVRYNVEVKEIVGNDSQVTGVLLHDSTLNKTEGMNISGVFLAIGHDPNSLLFKPFLTVDESNLIVLKGRSQATSIAGVYAAGDIADTYRQAGIASGDGIKAALDATAFLQKIGFNQSFTKEVESSFYAQEVAKKGDLTQVTTIQELTTQLAATDNPVFVDFYADYCPSCMQMLPVVQEAAVDFAGKATFVKVDTDNATELADEYVIKAIPALLVFKGGKIVGRYNQAMNKQELYEFVNRFVSPVDQN